MSLEFDGYHFVGDTLRDGRPVPADGETLIHDGPLVLCASGFHYSPDPFDALQYAPGDALCRIKAGGDVIHGDDKAVCTERTIVSRIDATEMLREFARKCALDVIHLWDAPDVVRQYLETGDESLRDVARDAALRDAARGTARDAAWYATWGVARDAAWIGAWIATWDIAVGVERNAARDAQRKRFNGMVNAAFDATRDTETK